MLLVLFAAEGVTILAVRQLLTLHFFLGMLLIGPVLLKASSTIYRFARYYAGAPDYRRKGPPVLPLRMLGPFVLATSFAVIGTGVALGYTGRSPGLWLFAHKAAFVLWFGVMTVHVLAYVWRLPPPARQRPAQPRRVPGARGARWPQRPLAAAHGVGADRGTAGRADLPPGRGVARRACGGRLTAGNRSLRLGFLPRSQAGQVKMIWPPAASS